MCKKKAHFNYDFNCDFSKTKLTDYGNPEHVLYEYSLHTRALSASQGVREAFVRALDGRAGGRAGFSDLSCTLSAA